MSQPVRERLPASERRAAVVETACRVFARCSYRGATTAEIAREAGVTEPILYRHFQSKQALYLACVDETWARVRAAWDEALAAEPDSRLWIPAMGRAFFEFREQRSVLAGLWAQALAEASDEPELRKHLRWHLRGVHDYVAGVTRRAQALGGIPADRDARAEAWIFIAVGVLATIAGRLGGLPPEDLEGIRASRRRWLSGDP
ncbi:MAG TPA: TetR/AcrR family transcriptional regulator [Gaiellaceae bacterium]|nr:TetR/AcrR family transcriptional regulator [Gaiellaceae bacterium]